MKAAKASAAAFVDSSVSMRNCPASGCGDSNPFIPVAGGAVPVEAGAHGVGDFGLEVDVAEVAVGIVGLGTKNGVNFCPCAHE